jgi:hypothetical protein
VISPPMLRNTAAMIICKAEPFCLHSGKGTKSTVIEMSRHVISVGVDHLFFGHQSKVHLSICMAEYAVCICSNAGFAHQTCTACKAQSPLHVAVCAQASLKANKVL